jgi:hypothetical protein
MSPSPHSNQPLDPAVTIDPTTVASFTGPDSHTGLFLDVDTVNSSVLVRTNDTNALYIDKYQNLGINTIAPAAQLDINSADGNCVQLTYNGTANTANLSLASDGKMTLSSTGSEVNVDTTTSFNVKSHNGSSTGLMLNNTLVLASADQINYTNVTPGTASASKAVVLDSNRDVTNVRNFTASQLTGTLQTASQPNVNSVNVLNVANHDGNQGLSLGSTLVTSSADQLNSVNVTPGSGTASKAVVLDASRNISNINNLTASQLTGTLQTASQPNVTAVGTLLGLDIDGSLTGLTNLSIDTTTTGRSLVLNSAVGNCFQMCYDTASGTPTNYVDMLISNVGDLSITPSGGNVNITSHDGSTQGLKLGGTLVTASADQINYLQGTTPGTASSGKALIFDSSRNIANINNLTASQLTGTVQTAAQPNINSVNVLNIANHNGSTIGLKLNGTLVTATATEINYIDTTPGSAAASKALVLDDNLDVSGINSLSATDLTGTLQTASQPNVTSVNVLNIASHDGSTQGLSLDGTLVTATATQLNYNVVTPGTASASGAIVLDSSSNISGINSLSATNLTGTLQTAAQPNVTSVGTLTSITTSGALTLGSTAISESEIAVLDSVTPGTVSASKALVVDANKDISSLRNLTATNLTGTIQTASQPNITSVSTLDIANHDGTTQGFSLGGVLLTATATQINSVFGGSGGTGTFTDLTVNGNLNITNANGSSTGLSLAGTLVTSSGTELNYLDGSTPGTAVAGKALVVDSNKDIVNIGNLSVNSTMTINGVTITASEANTIHSITAGTATANKALVLDGTSSVSGINSIAVDKLTLSGSTVTYFETKQVGTGSSGALTSNTSNQTLMAYSPTLRMSITISSTRAATTNYAIGYAPTGYYAYNSFGLGTVYSQSILWQPEYAQFIFYYCVIEPSGGEQLYYSTSSNGINWSAGSTITTANAYYAGSGVAYHAASGQYVFFTNTSMYYSVSGRTSWSILSVSNALNSTTPITMDSVQMLGSYVTHRTPTTTGNLGSNITYWNGSAWSVAGTLNTSIFKLVRVYASAEDRLYMLDSNAVNTASAGTMTLYYIDNFSTLAFNNWATGVQSVAITGVSPLVNIGMIYNANYDVIVAGTKSSSSDATNYLSSIRIVRIKNKQITYSFTDGPTESSGVIYKVIATSASRPILGLAWDNSLVISSTTTGATINSVYWTPTSASNGIVFGSTTITETEMAVVDSVTPGTASASKALVLDSALSIGGISSLGATSITGTLQTAAQPNVTSVGTLTSITTSGTLTLGSTIISASEIGVIDGVTPGTVTASKALVVDANKDISSIRNLIATQLTGTLQTAAQPNITSVGTLTSVTTSGALTLGTTAISESEIGVLDGVTPGTVTASKALVVDANKDISSIRNLIATQLTGTLQTAAQPNITSVGTLTSITTSGALTLGTTAISESEIGVLDGVTPGAAAASKALVLDIDSNVSGINSLSATDITGTLQTAAQPNVTSVGTLTSITTSGALTLGITTISESEIGVLDGVTPGTATATKALVVDSTRSIDGLTSITSTDIYGTIQSVSQPFITSVGTLDNLTIGGTLTMGSASLSSGEMTVLDGATPGSASASKVLVVNTTRDIDNIRNLSAVQLTGTLQTAAQPNVTSVGTLTSITTSGTLTLGSTGISESEIAVISAVTPGSASASKALVLNSSSNITGINSLTATSITATDLTGTLQTADQPNVTSVGTLTSITTSGALTLGSTAISESEIGVLDGVTPGTVTASKALVVDVNKDIASIRNLTASQLTGTLQTAAQPNVTSVGTLDSITTSGTLTLGSTTISESEIGAIDGVTPGTAAASKALVLDSSSDVSGINSLSASSLSATDLTGTLQTAAQPNITSVGTLTSVTTSGALTLGSTAISESEIGVLDGVTPGTVTASKALVVDANKDIASIRNLIASQLTGTLQTAAQPNITSVGTLDSIVTSGDLTLGATAISESEIGVLDGVTPGTVTASKALVVDANKDIASIRNLIASQLTGTLQTSAQPNVTSVGTLTSITTSGTLTLGSTVISQSEIGVIDGVTPGTAAASKALVLDSSSNVSGINSLSASSLSATDLTGTLQTAAQPNVTSVGTLTSITTSGALTLGSTTISESEIGVLDAVTPGTAVASKALVLDISSNVSGINSLSATDLTGTIQTAAQPNVTSVGTLTSITTSGDLTLGATAISESEIGVLDGVTPGTVTASKALVVDVNKDIASIRNLTASQLTGTLQTAAQPNITSVGTLTSITTSGALTLGTTAISESEIGVLDGVTPGTVTASKALVVDSNKDIASIRYLTASQLTGTIQTAAQPNITSVGTLTSISTSGSLTIGSTVISESEIGVLDAVTPGTAAASKALVLNSSSNVSGINSLAATTLAIGSPAYSSLPVEIGYTSYQFSGAYAYSNELNSHGLVDAGNGPSANYSLRADGRILVTGEVEITSDRRLKKDIVALTPDFCKSFISKTTPVRFNWRSDDAIPDYGYIAQDVLKAGFNDLVTVVAHPGMEGSEDSDGFINPTDAKFVFSPGKIIPMLALNQKQLFEAQDAKDVEISDLKNRLAALEDLVAQLVQKK